ncbi:hypothetical protein [Devosia ginsengisoli]|uniref:hypothetical protein n=1 Tax=Devosia ginsengisoli TaxID=400770 RepID=UPI0026EDE1C6|nr:hypothetical protein [Devosia ginsengisoli]MCR6670624.1 hypothetical protein [Devosia ginsengisoli]
MQIGTDGGVIIEAWDEIDHDILVRAFRAEDELSKLLLLTFEVEAQLDQFIKKILGEDISRLKFYEKCIVLKAIRFGNDVFKIVDGLRQLRNKFAHDKTASFAKYSKLVDQVINAKPPIFDDVSRFTFAVGKSEKIPYTQLTTDQKLVIFGIATAQFLSAAPELYDFPPPRAKIQMKGAML